MLSAYLASRHATVVSGAAMIASAATVVSGLDAMPYQALGLTAPPLVVLFGAVVASKVTASAAIAAAGFGVLAGLGESPKTLIVPKGQTDT